MNLSARNILQSVNRQTSEAIGVFKSRLELSLESMETMDALQSTRDTSMSLICMIDDLEHAKVSLEDCGFSQKWLDTINADGKFLSAVNLDLAKLCKSTEEQTSAAVEGIWSTIWDYIKKIWNFIIDMVKKVINFVKNLLGISKSDMDTCNKALSIYKLVTGGRDEQDVLNELGEAVNAIGNNGCPDLRQLITRASVLLTLAMELQYQYNPSVGIGNIDTTTGDGFFDAEFEDYAVGATASRRSDLAGSKANKIFSDLLKTIETSPSSIVSRYFLYGFTGFKGIEPTNLHEAMKESGVSVGYSGDDIRIDIKQVEGHFPDIDYKTVYNDIMSYPGVLAGWKVALQKFQGTMIPTINRKITEFQNVANEARKFANAHGSLINKLLNASEHKRKHDAFAMFSKWTMETANTMISLITAYSQTEAKCSKIVRTVEAKLEEMKKNK